MNLEIGVEMLVLILESLAFGLAFTALTLAAGVYYLLFFTNSRLSFSSTLVKILTAFLPVALAVMYALFLG